MLARQLAGQPRRYSYRFLFAPGTIGPLAWLYRNRERLGLVRHGLTVAASATTDRSLTSAAGAATPRSIGLRRSCCAISGAPIGWPSSSPGAATNASSVHRHSISHSARYRGRRMRPTPANHTSWTRLTGSIPRLWGSRCARAGRSSTCSRQSDIASTSARTESHSSAAGAVPLIRGCRTRPEEECALLWVLNLSDGSQTLLDIAARSGLAYDTVRRAARRLADAGLLS